MDDAQLFRLLVQSVQDYAIFRLSTEGIVETWNAGAQKLKGYTAAEIIGRSFENFYTPEDRAAGRPARLLAEARNNGRVEDEGWRVRKDGSRFWADVVITALFDEGQFVGSDVLFQKNGLILRQPGKLLDPFAHLIRLKMQASGNEISVSIQIATLIPQEQRRK